VQEGDICLLFPAKSGRRSTFMVYLLCATATHSIGGAGFQRVCPCPGRSCAKTASGVHIMDEITNGITEKYYEISSILDYCLPMA